MDIKEIKNILMKSISEIRELNGFKDELINNKTKPLTDLNGFDSLNAFEVTTNICEKTGFNVDVQIFGISCDNKDSSQISIEDIANNIYNKINE